MGGVEMGTSFIVVGVGEEPQGFRKRVPALSKKAHSTQGLIDEL